MTDSEPGGSAIAAKGIVKRFGGAIALDSVDIDVRAGECHAIVGENGAGKSTLMRILAGVITPDEGSVLVGGMPLAFGARSAIDAGIALVHQELSLVPEMTVAENILLGSTPTRGGFIRARLQRQIAADALSDIGVQVPLDEPVSSLSVASRQFVEIARAVARKPRVLILDEPTATLTPAETDHLLGLLQRLAAQGIAILYISHRLPEVFRLCSRATVLRDGKLIETVNIEDTSVDEMVNKIVGRELNLELQSESGSQLGEVVMRAERINAPKVHDVSLEVRSGEILGIGGLVGSGRSELVRAILGADPRHSGKVTLISGTTSVALRTYLSAVQNGVCFVPEERRADGLAVNMSVSDNVALPNRAQLTRAGVLSKSRTKRMVQEVIADVGLRPAKPMSDVGRFSGGNQQKVAIGKWLARDPKVFVVDEPTRGVDVGSKAEIHRLLRGLAERGCAVIMVSSDLPELLAMSDRIHVLRDGKIVGTLARHEANERAVMRLAAGGAEVRS